MARSLLTQLEQIRSSVTYDDDVLDMHNGVVAEPTVSGSLEHDMNMLRSLLKNLKGTTNWYDPIGTYTDPTNTASGIEMNLTNIAGNTLDSHTIIIGVEATGGGSGFTVSGTSTGVLLPVTTKYADTTDKTGIPIYESTANTGSYVDEGGSDNVCRIDVIDLSTDSEFQTEDGYTVYAKFVDGADYGGTGDGTDVYAKFYANGVEIDLTTISGGSPENISFVYPQRKVLSDMQEYEWQRTDFVNSWEGDVEIIEDITNLWSYTGAVDGETGPTWTNTGGNYALNGDPGDLEGGINSLNDSIGDQTFTEGNYINDGDTIGESLDLLDQAIADLTEGTALKYVYETPADIPKNTLWDLPYGIEYTPNSTAGREGANMDVYVGGQLLAADTGVAGANADRDYGETTASGITFRFNVKANRNITLLVRQ